MDDAERRIHAAEVGRLIKQLLALAPKAGLYVGIKVQPARQENSRG